MKKQLLTATIAMVFMATAAQAQLFNSVGQTSSQAEVQATTGVATASTLGNYFSQTHDLQGSFIQTVYSAQGQQKSKGQMWISKPGKFYWDYQSPDRQKIISNGKKVWQYDIDLEQVAVRKRDELVGDVAMQILSGEADLDSLFIVTKVQNTIAPTVVQGLAKDGEFFQLTPKQAQEGYDSVWMVLKAGELKGLCVDAGRGQQTVIAFSNLKRNASIPAKQFEFVPPKGVDVVGD